MSKAPAKVVSPHELRDRMIAGYARGYARAGIQMTPAQIEAQVIADCQLVDAARAAGDLSRSPSKPSGGVALRDAASAAAADKGVRVVHDVEGFERVSILHGNPQTTGERWGAAVARIARILEGVNRGTSNLVVAVESAELAALATEYLELWSNFKLRKQPAPTKGADKNPFRGLRDRDAARAFMRFVYDICDRSTGKLNHWFVK